jgi:hypothetical protein
MTHQFKTWHELSFKINQVIIDPVRCDRPTHNLVDSIKI